MFLHPIKLNYNIILFDRICKYNVKNFYKNKTKKNRYTIFNLKTINIQKLNTYNLRIKSFAFFLFLMGVTPYSKYILKNNRFKNYIVDTHLKHNSFFNQINMINFYFTKSFLFSELYSYQVEKLVYKIFKKKINALIVLKIKETI